MNYVQNLKGFDRRCYDSVKMKTPETKDFEENGREKTPIQ